MQEMIFLVLRLNVITSYFKEMDNYEKRYNRIRKRRRSRN